MLVIALHKQDVRIDDFRRGLRYENIDLADKVWSKETKLDPEIFSANILILTCSSPERDILTSAMPEIKKEKPSLPLVVVDENEDLRTKAQAAAFGAHYFAKPVPYRDLGIFLKTLASRKCAESETKWLRAFDVLLNLEQRFAKRSDRQFRLRNKEFALLEFFMINKGKVLTRNSILEHVWDRNANFASNTVDVHINRLRKKIDGRFSDKLIHTIHCVGYIFDRKKGENGEFLS